MSGYQTLPRDIAKATARLNRADAEGRPEALRGVTAAIRKEANQMLDYIKLKNSNVRETSK